MFAPIVLFVYNRPNQTKKVVYSLKNNLLASKSDLIIFSDGPKSQQDLLAVGKVRHFLKTIHGFKSVKIFESKINKGLADSIIDGVTKVVNKYGTIIVLEDDLETSPGFLSYMNKCLKLYSRDNKVMQICAYTYPVTQKLSETFFLGFNNSWGWATWDRAWKHFNRDPEILYQQLLKQNRRSEFNVDDSYNFSDQLLANIDGRIKTWAVRWYASIFLQNGLCLWPGKSMVNNLGADGSGTNVANTTLFDIHRLEGKISVKKIPINEQKLHRQVIGEYLRKIRTFGVTGKFEAMRRIGIFRSLQKIIKMLYFRLSHLLLY